MSDIIAKTELERRSAVAPVLALLRPYETRTKRDDMVMTAFMVKRLRSWVAGTGALMAVSAARPSFVAELHRVSNDFEAWDKRPESRQEKGSLPLYRQAYVACLDSLSAMACTGSYSDLAEALEHLDDLPSDLDAYEDAEAARAKNADADFPPTLGEVYDMVHSSRERLNDLPAEPPIKQTAQQKVTQLKKKAAGA